MKKILYSTLIITILLISITGCVTKKNKDDFNDIPPIQDESNINSDALLFKEEYESLNGNTSSNGLEFRSVSINDNNPFIYSTGKDIVEKIRNKETFYVYFGSSYCPWCRSVIEKFIEVANNKNIDKVYYVDIWKGDHTEIFRDVYKLNEKGKPELVSKGDASYQDLLKYFDKILNDYTLTTPNGQNVKVGEKRIFAPNFIYVEKGIAKSIAEGVSESQKDPREKLTKKMLEDEEKIFKAFFKK